MVDFRHANNPTPFSNVGRDMVPVRLPSGSKAILDLPRPFTVADATHLCAWIVQYIEGEQAEEAHDLVAPNAPVTTRQRAQEE